VIKKLSKILDLISDKSDTFSLVWRDHLEYNKNAEEFESSLQPFLIKEKRAKKWPGTELGEEAATIRFYRLNAESIKILKTNEFSYQFLSPYFPEDLAVYKGEKEIFSSCAHEKLEWLDSEI